eukprot:TRINITY_DN3574_c0_g1_i1.p1 TRINITY_DN3574_c0_g1~~TRINITY_DN3574_c0_g1_i1.p1  ORF type:complete len:566 (+),score=166.00 TRINITY_DN3574_c0_g1_i1:84-1781(+)
MATETNPAMATVAAENGADKVEASPPCTENAGEPNKDGGKKKDGKEKSKEKPKKKSGGEKKKQDQTPKASGGKEVKKETKLGLSVKKEENFGEWYSELVLLGEMIDYYDVSGCYILRPWSYSIWETIKDFLDTEIKKLGVENGYFPLFVSETALTREKDHVEGFAPEVAWVTKSGTTDLEVPIAVRPTSETVMYPSYAKWIRSHRDLPLKINQWNNVVRWEFKHPTPFIRSREFLWQEGHTAFATKEEADVEVHQILDLYRQVYEDYLAVPVIKGIKSEKEKFAGGLYTTTVEAFVPSTGRGIQGATSHCLGQNFAKMFDITFENKDKERVMVWQNSWGLTTRTIGVMVMVHGDDKGLVLPPKVAPVQAIVIPIPMKEFSGEVMMNASSEVVGILKGAGIRAKDDTRDVYTPPWKYNHWELKGVPLRVELGPRDFASKKVVLVRRDTGEKEPVAWDKLADRANELLQTIQKDLLEKARKERDACIEEVDCWDGFMTALNAKKMVMAPWCDETEVEEEVKKMSADGEGGAAKTLCMPFDQPPLPEGTKCFKSGKPAKRWALWGRSY